MTEIEELNHVEVPIKGGGKVFILDKGEVINSEAEAMLQALHSRSTGGFRKHLEVLGEKGADNFMSRFYVGYGHKSIGDCGSTTIFIEGVSMLVAKSIQDNKLYSGQEVSTRYVDFSHLPFINPIGSKEGEEILEKQRSFYLDIMTPVKEHLKSIFPMKEGENENIYDKAISARAFDIARGFLPAGASTNLAWHTNLRQAADKLIFLRNHPLQELRNVAEAIEKALIEMFPNSFTTQRYEDTEKYMGEVAKNYYYHNPSSNGIILVKNSLNMNELIKNKNLFEVRPNNKTELPRYLNYLGEVTFSFNLDFGSFRDLQRHRALNQRMPLLTTDLEFNKFYYESLPDNLVEKAKLHIKEIIEMIKNLNCSKDISQYYVPMGFNVSCLLCADLPALVYMVELRATRFVHPTLREVAREIAKILKEELGIKVMLDHEHDRFDIKRGEHDIIIK